jgi:16S rRNA (guanine527-N7)-methyltransferase
MTPALRERLAARLTEVGARSDAAAVDALSGWLDLHAKWSRAFNLTGTRDPEVLIDRHLADCAAVVPHLPPGPLADFGSGAGLPGLVVALLEPERPMVLIDSAGKRTRFLEQAVAEFGLGAVTVVSARIEAWVPEAPVAGLLARAVAPLAKLVAWTAPQLDAGVPLLAMKGPGWREEAAALPGDAAVTDVAAYSLGEREHVLLTVARTGREEGSHA